jgi:hypothetical protein
VRTWNSKQRKLLIILASLLAIILTGLLAVTSLVDVARIKNFIITQLEAGLRRNVAAQATEMTPLTRLGVWLGNVAISKEPSPLEELLKHALDKAQEESRSGRQKKIPSKIKLDIISVLF